MYKNASHCSTIYEHNSIQFFDKIIIIELIGKFLVEVFSSTQYCVCKNVSHCITIYERNPIRLWMNQGDMSNAMPRPLQSSAV